MVTKNLLRLINIAVVYCTSYIMLQGCSSYGNEKYMESQCENASTAIYKTKGGHEVQLETSMHNLCLSGKTKQNSSKPGHPKRAFVRYNTPNGFNCTKKLPVVISKNFDPNKLLDPANVNQVIHLLKNSNGEYYVLLGQIALKGGMKKRNGLLDGFIESKESRDQRTIENLTAWSMPQQPSYNPVREGLHSRGLDYANLGGGNITLTQYNPFGNSSNQSSGFGSYNPISTTGGLGGSSSSSSTGWLASLDVSSLRLLPKSTLEIALKEKAKLGNARMREKVFNNAVKHLGSMEWSMDPFSSLPTKIRDFANDGLLPVSPKCNKFIYDVLKECGIDMGKPIEVKGFDHPYLAKDCANKDLSIPGWRILGPGETPEPGDVIAIPKEGIWSSGHMGIVYKNGLTISASTADNLNGQIAISDWSFRSKDIGQAVIRRYIHAGELYVGKGGTPIKK
jgi:hypothetical protein